MKRLLTLFLAVCMILAMVPFGALAAEAGSVIASEDVQLKIGTNNLKLDSGYETTAFAFEPTETGVYTFTASSAAAVVEYWGGNPYFLNKQTDNGKNTLEIKVTAVGPTYMIGVSGVSSCTLTVTRTGNVQVEATLETVNYVNTHTPSTSYSPLTGNENMVFVDISKSHTAVKGSDGFYHLDSATGAILYMDFTGPANEIDMTAVGGAFFLRGTIYENGVAVKKYDFLDSIKAYGKCVDGNKLYPLTDDLILFLQSYGRDQGWYNASLSPFTKIQNGNFNADAAWMIICCYDKDYVHTGTPGTPGTGNTPGTGTDAPGEDDGSLGSLSNPIWLNAPTDMISIPAGKTQYYTGRFGGMTMTINGSNVSVAHNDKTYTAVGGKVTLDCVQESMWEPCIFAITNTGSSAISYAVSIDYPLGSMENPAALVLGSNTAPCQKDGNGYFYTWTASADGTLEIKMPSGNWMYTINNVSAGIYGELQYSDSKPVVSTGSVDVSAGDEIQVQVNTYNPDTPYNAPAGKITFTAQFKAGAKKFDIAFANMTLGNSLAMNFAFEQSAVGNASGSYAKITKTYADGRADKVVNIPSSQWGTAKINGVQHYTLKFDGVAAKEMSDSVYVCIYNASGKAISNVWEDSVRAYAMRTLNNSSSDQETNVMIVDLLNYGAAAQTYFEYNTGDLANNLLTAAQKNLATKNAKATDSRVKGKNYVGTNLGLESQILMRMAFQGVTSNMYAVISFTSHTGKVNNIRVEASEMNIGNGTGQVVIDDIVIADARNNITVTVYNANGTIHGQATDSVEGYIARMSGSDALFQMILRFSDSAYAFFH